MNEKSGLVRHDPDPGFAQTTRRGNRRVTPVAEGPSAREDAPTTQAKPVVVKLGGRALEAPGALREFAASLARLSRLAIVVHGGGAEVTAWCNRLGLEARFADGLRVTDAATLEVVAAILAGLANKRLVAALRAEGVDAVGLAALDGGIVRARMHERATLLGAVGEVEAVDPALLHELLAHGRTPVLASLAADPAGGLLNLNADDAACALAAAVGATDLILLSDTPGLVLNGALMRSVRAAELPAALAHADVGGGMVPKLRATQAALAGGVARVHLTAWSGPDTLAALLAGGANGTTFTADKPLSSLENSDAR